jgi:hypothetical protein
VTVLVGRQSPARRPIRSPLRLRTLLEYGEATATAQPSLPRLVRPNRQLPVRRRSQTCSLPWLARKPMHLKHVLCNVNPNRRKLHGGSSGLALENLHDLPLWALRCRRPMRAHLPASTSHRSRVGRVHFIQARCAIREVFKELRSLDGYWVSGRRSLPTRQNTAFLMFAARRMIGNGGRKKQPRHGWSLCKGRFALFPQIELTWQFPELQEHA